MPGGMPTTSPDELEIGTSTMPTAENTTKKPVEPSANPITSSTKVQHVLNISQHPLFEKGNHPTEGANTFAEFQDDINDEEYGPWWFEFLSRTMDYDRRLFDRAYRIELSLKRIRTERNQAVKERDDAIQEKDNAIQEHSNVQEMLRSAQIEVERLLHENKTLTSRLPSQPHRGRSRSRISSVSRSSSRNFASFEKKPHHKEHWTQSYSRVRHLRSPGRSRSRSRSQTDRQDRLHRRDRSRGRDQLRVRDDSLTRMTYRARGADPSKKLTGKNIQDYNPWAHSIRRKLKVDKILFPTNPDKTDYVFWQMEAPIWNEINTWVIMQGESLTVDGMFAEVENYMDVTQHKANAKKELTTVAMRQDETVSEFYHRIFELWTMAGTRSEDQIEMFQASLSPWICNQLSMKRYKDFNTLLQDARLVEGMRKKNATRFPRRDKPTSNRNSGSGRVAPPSSSTNENARGNNAAGGPFVGRQGFNSNPVATKPAGWTGQWYEPQTNPPKLTDIDRETLSKQGRCWSCRGSGHRGADSVCPNKKNKEADGKKRLNATREGHVSSEESEKE